MIRRRILSCFKLCFLAGKSSQFSFTLFGGMYVLYIFFKLIIDKKQRRERIDRCCLNKKWILSSSFLRFYLIEDLPSLLLVLFAKQLIFFFGHLVSNLADNSNSISYNRCHLVSRILWFYSKRTVKRLRIIDECGSEALTNCKKKKKRRWIKVLS